MSDLQPSQEYSAYPMGWRVWGAAMLPSEALSLKCIKFVVLRPQWALALRTLCVGKASYVEKVSDEKDQKIGLYRRALRLLISAALWVGSSDGGQRRLEDLRDSWILQLVSLCWLAESHVSSPDTTLGYQPAQALSAPSTLARSSMDRDQSSCANATMLHLFLRPSNSTAAPLSRPDRIPTTTSRPSTVSHRRQHHQDIAESCDLRDTAVNTAHYSNDNNNNNRTQPWALRILRCSRPIFVDSRSIRSTLELDPPETILLPCSAASGIQPLRSRLPLSIALIFEPSE
ncbi:hypothetical protein QBC36DRAFT_307066 [Triangularia setosa]|uniref:Uncharacterized protein n=1 Tax=Triangularia setosa TaxID=2587417 RepID=A0AAN7ACJ4_9PEZI|nr:hypothetical protein QBC36DRAFT_307066 [Podospora setosa]